MKDSLFASELVDELDQADLNYWYTWQSMNADVIESDSENMNVDSVEVTSESLTSDNDINDEVANLLDCSTLPQ